MEPNDPRALRISDAERHQVAELLRDAAAEGRLDVEELDERLEATYAAKTVGDLVPITADLPGRKDALPEALRGAAPSPRAARSPVPGPSFESSWAVMSETKRSGVWAVQPEHTAVAVMGSVVLDLRDAELTARETVITANAIMGSVEILVDAWTAVVVEGVGVMGSFEEARAKVPAELEPDSPVVRVKGVALMGSVEVKRRGESRASRRGMLGH